MGNGKLVFVIFFKKKKKAEEHRHSISNAPRATAATAMSLHERNELRHTVPLFLSLDLARLATDPRMGFLLSLA